MNEASSSTERRKESDEDPAKERQWLAYEGTELPKYIVLIWIAFLLFGFFYFARYLL